MPTAVRTGTLMPLIGTVGEWCNGSTTGSEPVSLGSNPSSPVLYLTRRWACRAPEAASCDLTRRWDSGRYARAMARRDSIGEAMVWVSRIVAVGLAMFLPAVAGGWVDSRIGTSFLGPVGLVFGFVTGLWWLVHMAKGRKT